MSPCWSWMRSPRIDGRSTSSDICSEIPWQITVNAVAPGPVATELFLKGKTEAQIDQFRKPNPLERLGRPEDVIPVVSFLAGPEGGWVNAQVLRTNGGFA